ncbi:hypothetical protein E2C01_087196 [Portunus trituberculatus]|uniref:Uncharacterized protein n=1 Tax=Portunus trituberculatus TaxID=210409 RepID=A0A5B7JIF1_PORTR|nr:hypothetical protein [Portunus trituberculatus]
MITARSFNLSLLPVRTQKCFRIRSKDAVLECRRCSKRPKRTSGRKEEEEEATRLLTEIEENKQCWKRANKLAKRTLVSEDEEGSGTE